MQQTWVGCKGKLEKKIKRSSVGKSREEYILLIKDLSTPRYREGTK